MKRLISLVATVTILLPFAGCGNSDDAGAGGNTTVTGSVNLYYAVPVLTGGMTVESFNAQFAGVGLGWKTMGKNGSFRFRFVGSHGFKFRASGYTRGSSSCLVRILINGNVYWAGNPITLAWNTYLIPASAFGAGENIVDIVQADDLTMHIMEAYVGDGDAFDPNGGGGGGNGGGSMDGQYTVHIVGTLSYPGAGSTTYNTTDYLTVNGNSITISASDGPYAGTIDSNGSFVIVHTMYDGSTMTFEGAIHSDGTVHGTYRHSVLDGSCQITGNRS